MSVWRFVLVLLFCAGTFRGSTAAATPPSHPPTGVDLVILIDQSGSMWGHPDYAPGPNDPHDHRIDAARATVIRLLEETDRSPHVHRISVVDFGDTAAVALSAVELRYDPADPGTLVREVESLVAKRIAGREWVNTNTPEAMSRAADELDAMAELEPRSGRRRIVLVITDGRANLPPNSHSEMRRRVRRQAERLNDRGAELWAIGLNDADKFWLAGDGAFWEDVAGDPERVLLAKRAWPELRQVVDNMVDDWLGIRSHDVIGNSFDLPPYVRRLEVRATFRSPGGTLRVRAPDGLELARTSGGATYTRFGLDDPPAGTYTLVDRADASVAFEMRPPRLERLRPAASADLEVENRVVFQAFRASDTPLEPISGWPIRARIEVVAEDGTAESLSAKYEGDGKFSATWRPSTPGSYRMRLEGLVDLADRTVYDVFEGAQDPSSQQIEVGNERPYLLRLDDPAPGGLRLSPWQRSTALRLELVDGAGQRVDIDSTVRDPDTWLVAEVIDASGVRLGGPSPLALDGDRLVAQVPLDPDWAGSDGLFSLGELSLRLVPAAGRLPEGHVLRAIELPDSAEALRVRGDPMTVGPIPLRLSYWLVLLATLPLLVLLAGAGWFLGRRVLPNLLIARRDASRGKRVELKVFDVLSDSAGVGGKSFNVSGAAYFKLDGQVRPSVGTETKTAEYFRVTRLDVPGRPRARIEYRWQGEKKTHKKYVTAGSPNTLEVELSGPGRLVAELFET